MQVHHIIKVSQLKLSEGCDEHTSYIICQEGYIITTVCVLYHASYHGCTACLCPCV